MIFPNAELAAARDGFLRAAAGYPFGKGRRSRDAATLVDAALRLPDGDRLALLRQALRVARATQSRTPGGARRLDPDTAEALGRLERMLAAVGEA